MTASNRCDADVPLSDPTLRAWQAAGIPWGDVSLDQPDGFGTISELELPSPDLNDDRGYGHGV